MNNCKILPALAAVWVVTAGVAKAEQEIIPSQVYLEGEAAGYWLIRGVAENPPGYVGPGKWVYCVDISPALGSAGGDTLHPQYYVVETGKGGWAWDDGSRRSNPCLQVQRSVALTPPSPPLPPIPLDSRTTTPNSTGTTVPNPQGPGSTTGSSEDSGDLFNDLRRR